MSPSPSLLNAFGIRSGASAWLLFGSPGCVSGLFHPISSRVRASSSFEKSLHSFTSPRKQLRTRDLRVKASPYFPFTFTFTHCRYEPSRSDPRRSMYEKRIKHKVATQAVKAKVKEKGGEAFTSNQLYHNKFRRNGEEVKVKTQNSWMRARTRTREDGEMYMSLKKRTCIL